MFYLSTLNSIKLAISQLTQEFVTMSATLSTDITQLQADVTALTGVVAAAEQRITEFASQLAAALAQAQSGGATAAQLQALTDLHTALSGDVTSLQAALDAHPLPAAPAAPAAP